MPFSIIIVYFSMPWFPFVMEDYPAPGISSPDEFPVFRQASAHPMPDKDLSGRLRGNFTK